MTPCLVTEKIFIFYSIIYQNIYKDIKSFYKKKTKNFQNEGVFEVTIMEWSKCINCSPWMSFRSQIGSKNNYVTFVYVQPKIKNFRKGLPKKSCLFHFGDHQCTLSLIFPHDIFDVKRTPLSIKRKIGPETDSFFGHFLIQLPRVGYHALFSSGKRDKFWRIRSYRA